MEFSEISVLQLDLIYIHRYYFNKRKYNILSKNRDYIVIQLLTKHVYMFYNDNQNKFWNYAYMKYFTIDNLYQLLTNDDCVK